MKKILKIIFMLTFTIIIVVGCSRATNTENENATTSKQVNIGNIENISLREMNNEIKVYYHDSDDILIKNENTNNYKFEENDKTLVIERINQSGTGDFNVYLPRKKYNEIKVFNYYGEGNVKVFDVKTFTLEVHGNNEIVVDKVEADYLRTWTKNGKVQLTNSKFYDISAGTEKDNKIIVDKVEFYHGVLKTEHGNIFANFIGNESDYKVFKGFENGGGEYTGKKIVILTNNVKSEVKFSS